MFVRKGGKQHVGAKMKEYCTNDSICRRELLFKDLSYLKDCVCVVIYIQKDVIAISVNLLQNV